MTHATFNIDDVLYILPIHIKSPSYIPLEVRSPPNIRRQQASGVIASIALPHAQTAVIHGKRICRIHPPTTHSPTIAPT